MRFLLFIASRESRFETKYIALFIVVIAGSLLLTSLMTLSEVLQRRKQAREERKENEEELLASSTTDQTVSSKQSVKQDYQGVHRGHSSPNTGEDGASAGTFRSSKLNENVSFRYEPYGCTCRYHCIKFMIVCWYEKVSFRVVCRRLCIQYFYMYIICYTRSWYACDYLTLH